MTLRMVRWLFWRLKANKSSSANRRANDDEFFLSR
jgi:hypothetical protein